MPYRGTNYSPKRQSNGLSPRVGKGYGSDRIVVAVAVVALLRGERNRAVIPLTLREYKSVVSTHHSACTHGIHTITAGMSLYSQKHALTKPFGTTSYRSEGQSHTQRSIPAFTKNTAFNKDFGTTSTTVARGNHTHSGVYEPVFKNTAFNKDFGTTSGTVAG